MATVIGLSDGRDLASSLGLRTRSRSKRWIVNPGTGIGTLVGWEPVQRIRRVVSISRSGELCCLMRMVHSDYDVIVSVYRSSRCDLHTWSLRFAAATKPRNACTCSIFNKPSVRPRIMSAA